MEVISVIKYEGSNEVFAYKHPKEDITIGSQLIVHESQEALFFRDGKALDLFQAGRHTLTTYNIPLLRDLMKLGTGGENVFHAEVYFINMTTQMGIRWGTDSKVRLFDPASGLHIEVGASGTFNLKVVDSRKLVVKIVGTTDGLLRSEIADPSEGLEYGTSKFRALIINRVKTNLARVIKEQNINILEVDAYLDVLSAQMQAVINESLVEYGLFMPEFYITTVMTPDDDPNYQKLKQQFADRTLKVREEEVKRAEAEAAQGRKMVEAQTAAQLKMVSAQGDAEALRIKAQAEADAYRMQAEAEAQEMRMKGYSYQDETARKVGMEAMQNGITGGGSGAGGAAGGIGEVAGLGVALGAMGGVINMTKDALNPIMGTSAQLGQGFGGVVSGNAGAPAGAPGAGVPGAGVPGAGTPVAGVAPVAGAPVDAATAGAVAGATAGVVAGAVSAPVVAPVAPLDAAPDASAPVAAPDAAEHTSPVVASWNCPNCGKTGIVSRFCPDCGSPCVAPKS
ncbi:MAG: SPFH domain-containing protein [Clostridiales bacterium]|nr:SPFH domain-containing protein [Clostridiales bacterium]